MDSSVALVQAASGLRRLMAGSAPGVIKDTTVAQVSALLYYKSSVVSKLTKNKAFINKFNNTIYDQLDKDFGLYMDAKARTQPKQHHHLYEWKKVGNKNQRLFSLRQVPSNGLGFGISFEFKESKSFVPTGKGKHKHVFTNKASIMEAGEAIVIKPVYSERLVFDVSGYTVFMPKGESVMVSKPGGAGVKNSFSIGFNYFFKSNLVSSSIKKSGFQAIFSASMAKALKVPGTIKKVQYNFSSNTIDLEADQALTMAFGGGVL